MAPHKLLLALGLLAMASLPSLYAQRFPYCRCERQGNLGFIQYVDVIDGDYCFEIGKLPCVKGKCCKMDLRKIEWDVETSCVNTTTVTASVNGYPVAVQPFFHDHTDKPPTPYGSAVLKLNSLDINPWEAEGTFICLRLNGQCDTLSKLCKPKSGSSRGMCQISMFNKKDNCCPISETGLFYPSPPPPPSPRPPPPPRPSPPPRPPPPRPSPPAPRCPICITLSSPTATLTHTNCNSLASYLNNQWTPGVNVTMTRAFTCRNQTDTELTVCGEASGKTGALNLAVITEDLFEVGNMFEAIRLSCATPALGGKAILYAVDYGTCASEFEYTQDCSLPEPQPFPFCACNRQTAATPFAFEPLISRDPGSGPRTNRYCFKTKVVKPYDPTSKCGKSTSIYKAEWHVNPEAKGKLVGLTAADKPVPAVWDLDNKVLRVTNLFWNQTYVSSKRPELCFELQDLQISDFCRDKRCAYSLFNADKDCCPLGTAALP